MSSDERGSAKGLNKPSLGYRRKIGDSQAVGFDASVGLAGVDSGVMEVA